MGRLLLLLTLCLSVPAWAQTPTDALSPGARRLYEEGRRLEIRGDWGEAAVRYRTVLELEPGWLQAVADLGRVLEEAGRLEEAEAAYRRAPFDPDAVEALGQLLLASERHEEAAKQFALLRDLRPDTPAFLVFEADALAPLDPQQAAEVFEEYLERPRATLDAPETLDVAGRVAARLRAAEDEGELDEGRTEAFLGLLFARLDEEGAEATATEQLETLRERFRVEEEAERLSRAADEALDDEGRATLAEARELLARGQVEVARASLEALVERAPRSAAAWGAVADARLAMDAIPEAEVAALRAEQLDPLDPVHSGRVGDLLLRHYGGRYDAEAAAAYARALGRPDAAPELWYRRALAERGAGMHRAAGRSFSRYLETVAQGTRAEEARRFVAGLDRVRPDPPEPPPMPPLPMGVSPESWEAYWIAVVLSRAPRGAPGDLESALEELAPVRESAPDWARAINLEAAIRLRQGDRDAARALYEESLERVPDQGSVLLVLADLLRGEDADRAAALEARAASLGEPLAHLQLGLRAEADWELFRAREHLEAYLAWSGRDLGSERDRVAVEAASRVARRLRGLGVVGGLGLFGVVALPLGLRLRRRGGRDLQALIEATPAVWPDVARILSALRHEVLKHHTTVLPAVAHELEVGDPALGAWAADRLGGPRGAIARFRGYVDELERLGRVHGVPLNLRYQDPELGPLVEAMDQLEGMLPRLRAGEPELAEPLRALSVKMNQDGYRSLGAMLRRLCLLPLEQSVFEESWATVQAELRSPVPLDLDLPEERVLLRVFRAELDDILTNLMRNALEAAVDSVGEGTAPRVGVQLRCEADEITGLERVAIRVRDNAPRRISTAMIRGRYIGRGLGLAVDLISRNGGSVHVEDEPGWEKAVVIRLPRAEAPDLEDG